ncbi:hypothetical protein E1293_14335 [Actinomadura darangshiensis]|uniref:Uncharacterized protein n=1 Tax=Actinomadura darangshiensis TaxID=705336 RepID=A0A4R5BID0_9ACTN|nr:hypothetical protein [Actinomadura darangshiensis]TDD83594.1 hypothetical protein E1293_14335 [Actinomadura darangshiensis]
MNLPVDEWVPGPFGLDALKGSTVQARRTVLAVAHHLAAATRLADVMPLLESDQRVAVAYTASPASAYTGGLDAHLRGLEGLVVPWRQAMGTKWDLVVAAGHGMLEKLHGPVMTLLHGAGPGKLVARGAGAGPPAARPVSGLIRERLVVAGRVVPSSIVLAHDRHLAMLERECPEARPVGFTGGDPCLDRLLASLPYRNVYRRALGVRPGRRLVFVSSTWRGDSLLGRHPDLLLRVAAALPCDRYQVVAALHPNVWSYHGRRQVLAWHADCLRLGVRLFPPEEGWRAGLVASDVLVGDHGSVTCYGAAIGVPVLLGTFPEDRVAPGTHVAGLGAVAPRVDWDRPLAPQLEEAAHAFSGRIHAAMRDAISSRPGEAARLIRGEMYRLLRLPDRERPPDVEPVPLPVPGLRQAA